MPLHSEATRDGVRIITFENPPINALGFALSGELVAAIDAAEGDASVIGSRLCGQQWLL